MATKLADVLLVFFWCALPSVAAESFYFVSEEGEVISTLTVKITGEPAKSSDIVSLTFTERGNELFGFGSEYQGDFDNFRRNFPRFTIDENGGLGGNDADNAQLISFGDRNPPISSVWGELNQVPGTVLGFGIRASTYFHDSMSVSFPNSDPNIFSSGFVVRGNFLLVPEPGMSLWCVLALTAAGTRARRRRSRTNRR